MGLAQCLVCNWERPHSNLGYLLIAELTALQHRTYLVQFRGVLAKGKETINCNRNLLPAEELAAAWQ